MPIQFAENTTGSVVTPPASSVTLFVDSADGVPKYKDSSGTIHNFAGFTSPMTTQYDIIVGGTSGVAQRLAKGANGTFLGVSGGVLSYLTPPSASLGSAVTTLTASSGVVNVDCSLGDYFVFPAANFTANVTSLTFSNLPSSGIARTLYFEVIQPATPKTFALPSSFKAIAGSDTAIQSGANSKTVWAMTSIDQGTTWDYAMQAGTP